MPPPVGSGTWSKEEDGQNLGAVLGHVDCMLGRRGRGNIEKNSSHRMPDPARVWVWSGIIVSQILGVWAWQWCAQACMPRITQIMTSWACFGRLFSQISGFPYVLFIHDMTLVLLLDVILPYEKYACMVKYNPLVRK